MCSNCLAKGAICAGCQYEICQACCNECEACQQKLCTACVNIGQSCGYCENSMCKSCSKELSALDVINGLVKNVLDNAKTANRNTAPIVGMLMRNAAIVVRANASSSLQNAAFVKRDLARIVSNNARNVINQCAKDVFQKELSVQVVSLIFVKFVANRNVKHVKRNGVKTARLTILCALVARIKRVKAALENARNVRITHVRDAFDSAMDVREHYAKDVNRIAIVMDVVIMYALTVSNNAQHARKKSATNVWTLGLNVVSATSKPVRDASDYVRNATNNFSVRIANRKSAKNVWISKLIVLSATSRHIYAATKSARNVQINFAKNVFLLAVNAKDAIRLFVLIVSSSNANHAHHYCAPIIHSQKTNAIDAVSRYAIIAVINAANATITFVGSAILAVNVLDVTNISVKIAPRIAPSVKDKFAKSVQIKESNASHATRQLVRIALENVTNAATHSVRNAFQMEQNVKVVIIISALIASYNVLYVKERCVMSV
ncbi:MAG: hypothetical protein EZS28_031355 [Streblomastix strix]|uniref:Uncharacterized protein n=1 Tax=Streblomastix strix TaxID=222440 RepID=A0A5J4URV3_9EUKA|nr:MAG: hypothetical protein EZS28_031355 [Streblomastix strix]